MIRSFCGPFRPAKKANLFSIGRAFAMSSKDDINHNNSLMRLKQLKEVLGSLSVQKRWDSSAASSSAGEWLHIGDVEMLTFTPNSPELVPTLYAHSPISQVMLRHLKWMLQKDALGQDMFLIGLPGPSRRHLAMSFCELTHREVEYVSLSRDTTETDLKQRREIINSTVHYVDQSAVRAALIGRVLILDGIEKAERNVLPILNNLLENREMQLDDGRFIVGPDRYDMLKQEHGESTLMKWKIGRVDKKFRVIALGLPVPPYKGNPLDPPLRSRFQSRTIFQIPFQTQFEELRKEYPNIDENLLSSLLSVSFALHSLSQSHLPGGPVDLSHHMKHIIKILDSYPTASPGQLLETIYPSELLGTDMILKDALQKFGLSKTEHCQSILLEDASPNSSNDTIKLGFRFGDDHSLRTGRTEAGQFSMKVPGWFGRNDKRNHNGEFISTRDHDTILAQMLMSHQSSDFCLVGGKGTGKTSLVNKFANILGYEVEPITLYQDMTSRELLQQRTTLENGDTSWRLSPLVVAALKGRLVVLDGMHRVDTSTLSVLQSIIQDRCLNLMDGTRLLSMDSYNATKAAASLTDQEMSKRNIFPIHPNFRLVGVGETQRSSSISPGSPTTSSTSQPLASWISPELISMFQFHHVKSLPVSQEKEIIMKKVPGFGEKELDTVLHFVHSLRSSHDPTLQSLSASVSTRQLLRMAKWLSSYPNKSLYQAINKACLSRFLPQMTKNALQQALSSAGISPPSELELQHHLKPMKCEIKDGYLHIGETSVPVGVNHHAAAMVPNVLFYDNELHLRIMEGMVQDFSLGEHLLLVGNQGVGKNKIVDRFLHLLNLPREYLQLHRDSTVQTLTLQPSVQSGKVTYQDSPLVRALESGMVLVVDEADKAPTHVTCVLKNIIEGSEITLADGRRIVHGHKDFFQNGVDSSDHIVVHPNFRMIVLANRPGFPFLGNDFFASLGDIFSCHAVDNPDLQSEKAMLQQYGVSVDDNILTKLVSSFSELRQMADEGLIAYPYSTREVVNIVKHMQVYPDEGIGSVVRNVFDFDSFNPELLEVVMKVLHKHGIPAGASRNNIKLAPQCPLPVPKLEGKWLRHASRTWNLNITNIPVTLKGPFIEKGVSTTIERLDSRGYTFSEMKSYCRLPLHETNHVSAVCTSCGNDGNQYFQVLTGSPALLYSVPVQGDTISCISLDNYFPSSGGLGYWKPSLSASILTGENTDKILIHEKQTNTLLLVKPLQNEIWRVKTDSLAKSIRDMVSWRQTTSDKNEHHLVQSSNNIFAAFKEGSSEVTMFDFSATSPKGWTTNLPVTVKSMFPVLNDQWILISSDKEGINRYLILDCVNDSPILSELKIDSLITPVAVAELNKEGLSEDLCKTTDLEVNSLLANSVIAATSSAKYMALVLKHLPIQEQGTEIYSFSIPNSLKENTTLITGGKTSPLVLPSVGEIIYPATIRSNDHSMTLVEPGLVVVDLAHKTWRRIILPVSINPRSIHYQREPVIHLTALDSSTIIAVDSWGTVRIIEAGLSFIQHSLDQWQKMVGDDENKELQITHSRDSGLDVSSPKHGKVDEKNEPHVGGNTWAGGTGGRDTAGLGGKGGPYRLDAGHDVHQLSDEEKKSVPEDVRKKAREMGLKARQERLREIEMSEHDATMYEDIVAKVRNQIQALRIVLSSIESKNKERQWIRHQTSGDLDERKLVEGLTGERSIYKRRGEKEPDFNSEQIFPTHIRLVVDVSGSMYRFNGYDGRLDRTVEAVLMVMEACQKLDNFKVDIVGHSGDSDQITFVSSSNPPSNDKERLQVLKSMIAESQFCWSGDNTIEATRTALKRISEIKAEKRYVIVLSDANFSRYGIKPADFARLMLSDPMVNVYTIFIGSLGDQAIRLKDSLPAGNSYICMDNKDLPNILKSILSAIN